MIYIVSSKNDFINVEQFGLNPTKTWNNCVLYELNTQDGYGKMLVCNLFPGIDIYYNDYNTSYNFSGKFELGNYLQISYSYEGTYEFELRSNRCIYIGEGEIIAFHNIFESVCSRFPLNVFKGLGIIFDIDKVNNSMENYFDLFGIDLSNIIKTLCSDGSVFVSKGNIAIRNILEDIYAADPQNKMEYIRIKVLELLNLLCREDSVELKYGSGYYEKRVIHKINKIRDALIMDVGKHITIEELAKEYNMSVTMLKNCFKDIYGVPPYQYLKQRRMDYAATLIRKGNKKFGEIAGMVGYQNASKFSSAFKSIMGSTPSEYSQKN